MIRKSYLRFFFYEPFPLKKSFHFFFVSKKLSWNLIGELNFLKE